MEIQPGCNFTCGHCSSHGTPELHRRHNRMKEMDAELLAQLAHEVFPHLTMINLVGRGEPLMVSDRLWNDLIGYLQRYRVLLSIVTNGYFIERRITADVLPLLDTLTVSIDGLHPQTFAANRGGASFEKVMAGVRHFHALRQQACLPRRPKLCLSWTLKKNNLAELCDFVRLLRRWSPTASTSGICSSSRIKTVSSRCSIHQNGPTNTCAKRTPSWKQYGIETDCPPLFEVKSRGARGRAVPAVQDAAVQEASQVADPTPIRCCTFVHRTGAFLSGGEMSVCGVQYAEKAGDLGLRAASCAVEQPEHASRAPRLEHHP